MSVLLIGSTGMGKSTFGNFLLDPNESHMFENQTFASATDNKPMTQEVKVASKRVSVDDSGSGAGRFLNVIDTPGLNESASKDLSHMIKVIKAIKRIGAIQACILVIRFNAKIDAQYKATLEYYSRLLPGLFDNNVIVVMTDFATDERSETLRVKQNINVEQVKRNTVMELSLCSNRQLTYSPQIFTIDCLPLSKKEMEVSQNIRRAILNYMFKLQPVTVKDSMVAKTDRIKQLDAEEIRKLQGQVDGYNERLKEVHKGSKEALNETQKKEVEITNLGNQINDLKKKLEDLDKSDDVVAEHWSIEESWKALRYFTREFQVESPYEMTNHTTWTNGHCEFKEFITTTKSIKGKVEGEFMRGIYASVTIHTQKRQKYAEKISELEIKIHSAECDLGRHKVERDAFQKSHQESINEIQTLQKYINEKNEEISNYSSDLMSIDEAAKRLEELKI